MKSTHSRDSEQVAYLDLLIAEITTDAQGSDEQLWAFLQAIQAAPSSIRRVRRWPRTAVIR
jgi:hypothetical protein